MHSGALYRMRQLPLNTAVWVVRAGRSDTDRQLSRKVDLHHLNIKKKKKKATIHDAAVWPDAYLVSRF